MCFPWVVSAADVTSLTIVTVIVTAVLSSCEDAIMLADLKIWTSNNIFDLELKKGILSSGTSQILPDFDYLSQYVSILLTH